MDDYPVVPDSDSTKLQERHYYLLSELQTLVKDLPSSFQQRLTYNTLSDLALALIDGTVYEIVQGLLDIQHLTEKNLYNQRQKLHCEHQALKQDLVRKHKDALQSCKPHNLSLLKTSQQTELEALEVRVRDEQKMMDKKIVVEMDQKVTDQQNTLEKAGVPGFYITTNPLAGASSVWASCCGLLNEVMGTGAVRGQQPGFGAGAGPFRFAPSAGYSTHPPNSSGNPGLVCRACGQAFSVFRIKYTCCDCKKSFCSLCTEVLESLRICATCHLLKATAFHRPRLMRLPVRDLRQYLLLRSISTDTCREKEDLVDLVLCHRAFEVEDEEEEDEDDDDDDDDDDEDEEVEDPNTASLLSHIHRTLADSIAPPASELSAATLEESLSRSESPETNQTSPQTRHGAGASVSDISSVRDIKGLSVRQLKEILARNFVNYSGCCEKWELVERVNRLYREKEKNTNTYGEKCPLTLQDDNLCRICMDAVIDCVLLECGHLVTCTDCGKRMNQCPICRQYVVRAVHVFKC